jgi:hypothetical protein
MTISILGKKRKCRLANNVLTVEFKSPIVAGMSFDGKVTKMKTVGYDIVEIDYNPDMTQQLNSERRIKRVFNS